MILIQEEGADTGSLPYAIDSKEGDLTLAQITESAIDFLTKGKNKGFFRVFLVKLISNFDGIIHIRHFVEHRSGIIPVTSPVYLTPFYHQKETA